MWRRAPVEIAGLRSRCKGLRPSDGVNIVTTMTFHGWSEEAFDFYRGLEDDNSKSYWTTHRPVYDSSVLAPMTALLEELGPEFGVSKVFRPNRDIRFSADKSPYKTAIGALFERGGYIQFSAKGLAAGSGYHRLEPDQLTRFRDAVANEVSGPELVAVLKKLRDTQIETYAGEELKTAPRGFPKDHPRVELLRRKDLAAWRQWDPAPWMASAAAKARVVGFLRNAEPLADWLNTHVGPSSAGRRR